MFTKNKFAQMDSIANLINTILETDTKAKMEELKGNQHKIDKNKNNKIDAHDFKILRGEKKVEESSHQAKTTMKHVKNPTAGEKAAAKDIKPGVAGYRDRIAMLKSAEARGGLKKEETEQVDEAVDMSDAKSVAAHLAKKAISLHGISNPTRAAHHAKNADAIEKTIDRVKRSSSPSSLAKAHTEVGSVSTAVRRMNVGKAMSSAEKSAHKSLQSGVVKHLQNHLDQHKAAFRNAAAKFAAKNEEVEQVDEAKEPGFRDSYGLGRKGTTAKKPETYGKRVTGKGYDKPENERKAPEGNVAMTSMMPGHDERAAKFLARQAKGTLVKGKAQSAKQMEKEEIDPKKTMTDTLKGREKDSSNPFLSKKVMMDVPDNVKEQTEQIDERTLTAPETAEKERIVKGMKKSLAGFKSRYGDRAKSVMYATATKAAKERK